MDERQFIKWVNEILGYQLDFDSDFEIRQLLKKFLSLNQKKDEQPTVLKPQS